MLISNVTVIVLYTETQWMNYLGFIGSAKNIYSDCDAWIVYNGVVGSAMIQFELLNERFSYIEIINIYIYISKRFVSEMK